MVTRYSWTVKSPGSKSGYITVKPRCFSSSKEDSCTSTQMVFYSMAEEEIFSLKQPRLWVFPAASPKAWNNKLVRNLFSTSLFRTRKKILYMYTASSRPMTKKFHNELIFAFGVFNKLPYSHWWGQTTFNLSHPVSVEKGPNWTSVRTSQTRINTVQDTRKLHAFLLYFCSDPPS